MAENGLRTAYGPSGYYCTAVMEGLIMDIRPPCVSGAEYSEGWIMEHQYINAQLYSQDWMYTFYTKYQENCTLFIL